LGATLGDRRALGGRGFVGHAFRIAAEQRRILRTPAGRRDRGRL
jgi:hypothetical protein